MNIEILKNKFAQGHTKEVLDELNSLVTIQPASDNILLLLTRYSKYTQNKITGTESSNKLNLELRQINANLLTILNDLPQSIFDITNDKKSDKSIDSKTELSDYKDNLKSLIESLADLKAGIHPSKTERMPKRLFISYSHKDISFLEELKEHLSPLEQWLGKVDAWTDKQIVAGDDWNEEVMKNLKEAEIILFLVSASSLSSRYIKDKEIDSSLKDPSKIVVPIIIRDCKWDAIPALRKIQALPQKNGKLKAVDNKETWGSHDEAWTVVVDEIERLLKKSK